jgi:hypothetical protein
MGFLQNLFGKKENPINSYEDFWNWFVKSEQGFYKAVKSASRNDIVNGFFKKLEPALAQVKSDLYYLAGMYDDNTAELVLTAEGAVKNMVFVEDLVQAAPPVKGWKFTALKPALKIEDTKIEMDGFSFDRNNLSFYPNVDPDFPDEIDITIIHTDYSEDDKRVITNGSFIFLDNYLGELHFAETIDHIEIKGINEAEKELMPIEKLKYYLTWRQKEFIEKYEGVRYGREEETYSIMEAKLQSGLPMIATINTELLEWDAKASHPWMAVVEFEYDGSGYNGLPRQHINEALYNMEEEITEALKQAGGCLHIGRQSAKNIRKVYYACREFRQSSKIIHSFERRYADKTKMSYNIFLDKYWHTVEHFRKPVE